MPGAIVEEIIAIAEKHHIELIVVGNRGMGVLTAFSVAFRMPLAPTKHPAQY